MKANKIFNQKTYIETALLSVFVALVIVLYRMNKNLYVAGVSIVYCITLFIFLCYQYRNYSVLNKHGEKSVLLFILSIYTKLQIIGIFMQEHSYPIKDSTIKIASLVFSTFLLIGYLSIILHKKSHGEIFNTIIYLLPLLLAWL